MEVVLLNLLRLHTVLVVATILAKLIILLTKMEPKMLYVQKEIVKKTIQTVRGLWNLLLNVTNLIILLLIIQTTLTVQLI
jgi:hypothetical protein